MVNPAQITTYADLDVLRQTPSTRSDGRTQAGATGRAGGPIMRGSRSVSLRRQFNVTLAVATRAERDRVHHVWQQSAQGSLPVSATPPEGGAAVPVIMLDDVLEVVGASHAMGSVTIRVERWRG